MTQSQQAKLTILIVLFFPMAVSVFIRPYSSQDWREMADVYFVAVRPLAKDQAGEYHQLAQVDIMMDCFIFEVPVAGIYTISTSCSDKARTIACLNDEGDWSANNVTNVKINSLTQIATFKALSPGLCTLISDG